MRLVCITIRYNPLKETLQKMLHKIKTGSVVTNLKAFIMIRTLTATLLFTFFATPAFAYIDAAMGGLILQAIIAGFFGFMVMWRGWIDKLKAILNRAPAEAVPDTDEKQD